ncbi:MAG: zinc-binding dehydrogenase [Kiritimatiellaeota bacterium]|nr:zinc-binding dehydrogenase [Kiritimatiellota bacterium]
MRIVRNTGKETVSLVEVPDCRPGPGEVVVQTAVSALCGSELHAYRAGTESSGNNGHEAAGTVIELGAGVESLRVGDRIGASAIAGCGRCPYCARGIFTWCDAWKYYANMHGERFVIAANACHRIEPDLPWDVAVLIAGDGLGVPYHTSKKLDRPGIRTVAVFGLGPIGLGNVLVQAHFGRRVLGVDVRPWRLDKALELGADAVLDAREGDPVERLREMTGGRGVDAAIEAAGRPETAHQCFAAVCKGGGVVFNGEQGGLELSPSDDFIRRDVWAVGSWFYHFHEFSEMLRLYRAGLRVQELVSHRFPFAQAAAAFREFAAGRTAKAILEYGDETACCAVS